jgi:hypothetical protein
MNENLDAIEAKKQELIAKISSAMDSDDEKAVAEAYTAFFEHIQESVLAEARGLQSAADTSILAGRGVNQLTSEETAYFNKVIEAMKSTSPKQSLENLDVAFPRTTIERVFEDLVAAHPLLDAIQFHNTTLLTEWIMHDHDTQLGAWGELTDEIKNEIKSAFRKMNMSLFKVSAFMVVAKAMLDLGPAWLDRYVRVILAEALALALEEAIINGTGKDMPIGMNRSIAKNVSVTDGVYPEKTAIKLKSFEPEDYGCLIADNLAKTEKGKPRVIQELILICNPTDYLKKIMPATTVKTQVGTYINDVFPFPTRRIQSVRVTEGEAIIGIPSRYFMGIGAGTDGGKLEYSDEYQFLEDQRVYRIKMYGNGRALDDTSFVLVDIKELMSFVQRVYVTNMSDANTPII